MPIYEYRCSSCEKVHEVWQKFSDSPMETCPDCGAKVAKLMSLSGFALKGGGWYTTDYKRSAKSGADSGAKGSDSPAKETKVDATPSPAAATASAVSSSEKK